MRPIAGSLVRNAAEAQPPANPQWAPQVASPQPACASVALLTAMYESGTAGRQHREPPGCTAAAAAPPLLGRTPSHPASRSRSPLPAEWQQSPQLAHGGGGAAPPGEAAAQRELFDEEGDGSSGDDTAAGREARLAKIRARFGTKRFLPARQLQPAELRVQLGAAEIDLEPDDYVLRRWDPMPVVLSGTSNAFVKKWVLTGQSGSVGLASTLTHVFLLGAGQTIYLEDAGAMHAARDEAGVALQLGTESRLTLQVRDEDTAAAMVATINGRAATHRRLQQRRAAAAGAAVGAGPS